MLSFRKDVTGVCPNLNLAYLSESPRLPAVIDVSGYAAQFPVMHNMMTLICVATIAFIVA